MNRRPVDLKKREVHTSGINKCDARAMRLDALLKREPSTLTREETKELRELQTVRGGTSRRGFLSLSLLAPVAGAMAARDAMAAPALSRSYEFVTGVSGEGFDGSLLKPLNVVRKLRVEVETFGVDNVAPAIPTRPAEDQSVSAQFESDLAFLRDEPGVAS